MPAQPLHPVRELAIREHSARLPVQFFEVITTDGPFALILPAHSSLSSIGLIGRVRAVAETLLLASITAALIRVTMPLVVPEGMPLTAHMINHLVWMNVVAPIAAWQLHAGRIVAIDGARALVLATVLQIVILWTWHAPSLWQAAQSHRIVGNLMPITMLAAAVGFWLTVFGQTMMRRWRAVIALLITGKLFCLLGALLIFAPRTLYAHAGAAITLHDQQIAGLIMVAVCPLTYVAAGVAVSACWLNELGRRHHQSVSNEIRQRNNLQ